MVADATERRIVLFSEAGAADPLVLGRQGAGPGEFTGLRLVAVTDDGLVAAYDRALRRVSLWSPEGDLVGERFVPRTVWSMRGDGEAVLLKVGREGSPIEDGGFGILRLHAGTEEQEELFTWGPSSPAGDVVLAGDPLPQVCSICPFFHAGEERWIFQPAGFGDHVVRSGADGTTEQVWTQGRRPGPLSDEEWLAERRRRYDEGRTMMQELTPQLSGTYPAFNPEASGTPPPRRGLSDRGSIGVDGRGRLWTLPSLPPDSLPRLELHVAEGGFLGTFLLDAAPVQMDVRGDRIALVFEDDLGLATIRLLRIVELEDTPPGDD